MFWWLNEENKNVYECGLMDFDVYFIEGNKIEKGKVSFL